MDPASLPPASTGPAASAPPRFLVFGAAERSGAVDPNLDCAPPGAEPSFLDYDGVAIVADAASAPELNTRTRESMALLDSGRPVILLVSDLWSGDPGGEDGGLPDLFRRILKERRIEWSPLGAPVWYSECWAGPLTTYLIRFGRATVAYSAAGDARHLAFANDRVIAISDEAAALFVLPCASDVRAYEAARWAVSAVTAIRRDLIATAGPGAATVVTVPRARGVRTP